MAYEKKEGDISVFANSYKTTDAQPAWKGNALLNGVEYEVVFWKKNTGKGTFLAGKIQIPRPRPDAAPQPAQTPEAKAAAPPSATAAAENDLPF